MARMARMHADDDQDRPVDLLRNLRTLVELDTWFGVETLPKPASDESAPASPSTRSGSDPAAAPVKPAPPKAEPVPDPVADLPTAGEPQDLLRAVAERIASCQRCGLCAKRSTTVPGEGNPQPEVLFIGEGPGADEDRQGRPFVGAAGQLLDKMIVAMGFAREQVFIANVVKCRPPGNRNPEPEEIAACLPYLDRQIDILKPKVICTLGNVPLRALRGEGPGITRARGTAFEYRGYQVIPTFHPSYLLRNEAAKKPCWQDLQAVLTAIGREPPGR